MTETLLVLLGPTASGKEAAAVHAASLLGAEIVTCDSVKPYRGLAVAAAAPPRESLAAVPHHLVGVLEPTERLDASRWRALAVGAIEDIRARRRRPLVSGGTALYLKSLLFGLIQGPPRDADLRVRLAAEEDARPGTLHERLQIADPVAAGRLHPNDRKRLLRALEVHEATGAPISARQTNWAGPPVLPYHAVGLRRARDDLRERIARRVRRMADAGLVGEVRALHAAGRLGPTAREAIGVKELLPVIEDGADLDTALETVRAHTWQLARRQRTWFSRFPSVTWLDVAPDEPASSVGERAVAAFEDGPVTAP